MKYLISILLILTTFICQGQKAEHFDYFVNNWNVVGLKDYPRGARVTPNNAIILGYDTLNICYGQELTKLSRKQDKLALNGWLPVMVIRANEDAIRYEFTYWVTPMPDVQDWKKTFNWPTEGENFMVWVKYH